ncbi:MAG: glycoside hydrolase family 1 protein [Patescibacteria group bacterium]
MFKTLAFPDNFLWGSAVSAHQTEGNNTNSDWWEWEQKGGGSKPSGIACDFYNRYKEDISLVKKLNQNAFRLSIEWAKIEPEEGKFSSKETEHYKKVLEELKKNNIKTFVTLHHFTNPVWFTKKGGWLNPKSPQIFCNYAKYCQDNFSDLVDFWITINEPTVYAGQSYFFGLWPPQKRNVLKTAVAFINMIKTHNRCVSVLKKPAGIAHNVVRFDSATKYPWDNLLSKILNKFLADGVLFLCTKKQGFIGVNYYFQYKITNLRLSFDYSLGKTDMKWPFAPEGLYKVLINLKKYKKPLYITENGCADSKDAIRKLYIGCHLESVHRAIEAGADVKGYFHWSLMDNFEWHLGFKPRFGLIEIERENNLKRVVRPSARYYAKVCEKNLLLSQKSNLKSQILIPQIYGLNMWL